MHLINWKISFIQFIEWINWETEIRLEWNSLSVHLIRRKRVHHRERKVETEKSNSMRTFSNSPALRFSTSDHLTAYHRFPSQLGPSHRLMIRSEQRTRHDFPYREKGRRSRKNDFWAKESSGNVPKMRCSRFEWIIGEKCGKLYQWRRGETCPRKISP